MKINNIESLPESFIWRDDTGLVTKSLGEAAGSQKIYLNIDYVPPGEYSTKYHSHTQQEEFFLVIAGEGTLRLNDEEQPVVKGDFIAKHAGGDIAHTFYNSGSELLVILDAGTVEKEDICHYPDEDIYLLKVNGERQLFKGTKPLAATEKKVRIHTFGHFAVWVGDKPLYFANSKAKELLAILVNRQGEIVTMEQAIGLLWEDRPYDDMVKRLYRKAVAYLHHLCKDLGLHFFVANRGCCHILTSKVCCDYYDLLNHADEAIGRYAGEYMTDYFWAEETNGKILNYLKNHNAASNFDYIL